MKPYGNCRRDNLACKWGCCHGPRVRGRRFSPKPGVRRASKRRARAEAKKSIEQETT